MALSKPSLRRKKKQNSIIDCEKFLKIKCSDLYSVTENITGLPSHCHRLATRNFFSCGSNSFKFHFLQIKVKYWDL